MFSGWRSGVLVLAGVTLATWAFYRLSGNAFHPLQLLTWAFVFKMIALLLVVRVVYWGLKTRSRFVILPFSNYSSGDALKTNVQGLATLLMSELAGLSQLSSTIDEMTPQFRGPAPKGTQGDDKDDTGASGGFAQASLEVPDIGSVFQGMISGESKVRVGPVELPLGALFGTFGRIVQGPTISGSLHKDGSGTTLIASLTGGGHHGRWCVRSEDLEEEHANEDSALREMIEQMAFRIFTDLINSGSRRWRAVRFHCQGLRFYRDQLNTQLGRTSNLWRSERAFIKALAEDNQFAQNHYDLGNL